MAGPSPGAKQSSRLKDLVNRTLNQPVIAREYLTVILESGDPAAEIRNTIANNGGMLRYRSGNHYEIRIPADKLQRLLERLPPTVLARPPWPHEAVSTVSQGVAVTGASDMHLLGTHGAGVKIGVIDLGFSNYTASQASGDLPAGLTITDYTGGGTGGSSHGTKVAEIVHDMAPGASLHLARIGSEAQLQAAVNDMIASGVKVINHSVAWFTQAFYDGTGPICDITATAKNAGILWVNAAGNYRNQHYLASFTDADGDNWHDFATGVNFNTINLTAGKSVTLVLNWNASAGSSTDYNLYLYDGDPSAGGEEVASSTNNQLAGYPYPYEDLVHTATTTGNHYIVIKKKNSATPHLPLSLFSLGKNLGIKTPASSLAQPADCSSVLAVGATNLSDNPEGFSSEGPTTDGRDKPDISAPNRVATSLSGSFAGTSSASPHAAGAAALVLADNPGFTLTQVRDELSATAHDVSATGFDYRTGYGRISLDADGDGVNHDDDNCPLLANAGQLDTDSDDQGDVCDTDDDNDGLSDVFESDVSETNPLLGDSDGDGLSDYAEVAWDGDASVYNPYHPLTNPSGTDLDANRADTDGDGIEDDVDAEPLGGPVADGDLAPLGNPDGIVNAADYLIAVRIVLGKLQPTSLELAHGDLYPPGAPDGVIDMSDLLLLMGLVMQQ